MSFRNYDHGKATHRPATQDTVASHFRVPHQTTKLKISDPSLVVKMDIKKNESFIWMNIFPPHGPGLGSEAFLIKIPHPHNLFVFTVN